MGRIVLNETSYHGAGCIAEIATEVNGRAFKKAFVCSDPDLIKFGVTAKVTKGFIQISNLIQQSRMYRQVLRHSGNLEPTISSQSAAVHRWILPRLSVS